MDSLGDGLRVGVKGIVWGSWRRVSSFGGFSRGSLGFGGCFFVIERIEWLFIRD